MQGILLMNLGSPDSTAVPDVRKYLREFLMDKRVLDAPYPIRFGVVEFGILPKRPKQSAEAYKSIWTAEGSPLIVTGRKLRDAVQARAAVPVELAMRYQSPSVEKAVESLARQGVTEIILLTLFPHYAMSSYETAVEKVRETVRRHGKIQLQVIEPFYDHPAYLAALTASAENYLTRDYDHLLFSFHGLPERHMRKADPTGAHCMMTPDCCKTPSPAHKTCYRAQCFKTAREFVRSTGVPEGKYSVAFQSRLGREPWLRPYTDLELIRLAESGVKKLLVICPAFVADCLETLEEIQIRGRASFLAAGGESLIQIPCLNLHPKWIEAVMQLLPESVRTVGDRAEPRRDDGVPDRG
jgi:ferrochelatase